MPGELQDGVQVTQGGREGGKEAGADCTTVLAVGPHIWGTGPSREPRRATAGCRQQVASTSGAVGGFSGVAPET